MLFIKTAYYALLEHWRTLTGGRIFWPVFMAAGLAFCLAVDAFDFVDLYLQLILIYVGINIILTVSLNLINGYMGEFSVGHAGFMAVGRALMTDAQMLLLDEPSMGLAPVFVREIFKIIREINQAGKTILLVEQNAHMSLHISRRGYVLETGRIVLSGAGGELTGNPRVKEAYLGG